MHTGLSPWHSGFKFLSIIAPCIARSQTNSATVPCRIRTTECFLRPSEGIPDRGLAADLLTAFNQAAREVRAGVEEVEQEPVAELWYVVTIATL